MTTMTDIHYDLIVIGAGVGGYVAAIRASQLGMRVACIDKRATLGGTCLNVGCIPSKALLHSSQKYHDVHHHAADHGIEISGPITLNLQKLLARKNKVVADLTQGIAFLFKKNNITFIQGTACFSDVHTLAVTQADGHIQTVTGAKILIATGSESMPLPGIEVDEQHIVSSTGALSLSQVPEHLIVIGGGYIGIELGSVWRRLGAKVTVIEYADTIVPALDQEIGAAYFKSLRQQGLDFKLRTQVLKAEKANDKINVTIQAVGNDKVEAQETLTCDVLLSCAGRRAYAEGLGLETLGIQRDDKGRIQVDNYYATSVPHIYAVGDVISGPMLAHKAEEEAIAVVEMMVGQKPHVNYQTIPAVIYTHPEVAFVGKNEQELQREGHKYRVGKFPFSANSRARPNGDTEGFVKILADDITDEVLGVHIIHADAGTLIAEAVLAMEFKASAEDIARTCHAHPTLNEAVKEAALNVYGKAIHM